jgi:hypothetical protein
VPVISATNSLQMSPLLPVCKNQLFSMK